MRTSSCDSLNNLNYFINGTYLEVITINSKYAHISWLSTYGPVVNPGNSQNILRITNRDDTTVDLYFTTSFTESSNRTRKSINIPLHFKNIELIQNATEPSPGVDPGDPQ